MDTTFISIHDLTLDARLLYVSNSIGDILGYHPDEVVGKSCWDYFHPDEIPFAKAIHGRGVELDKAAVLNYCQIKCKDGTWIGCECCFTVVHDVLVGCTSIYRADPKSIQRAANAPIIRQLFSSSPRDPRYHMLSYISSKFSEGPRPHVREPRAALFLNRFTRTLTIMYATNGLEESLGISSAGLQDKSFYYCIQENCLPEAIRCLESAKANDSIAYLRFWYRDPRTDDNSDHDETMSSGQSSDADDDEDGGVHLQPSTTNSSTGHSASPSSSRHRSSAGRPSLSTGFSTSDSTISTDAENNANDPVFDRMGTQSSHTSISPNSGRGGISGVHAQPGTPPQAVELEAVVSCTSDGLVVILRAARPFVPDSVRQPPIATAARPPPSSYTNGLFASPWATEPVLPPTETYRVPNAQPDLANAQAAAGGSSAPGGPLQQDFMNTIREAAVFAWALTGINGSLAQYGRGRPAPGAQPYGGLPVWDPQGGEDRMQLG